jgi:hypothetical protein
VSAGFLKPRENTRNTRLPARGFALFTKDLTGEMKKCSETGATFAQVVPFRLDMRTLNGHQLSQADIRDVLRSMIVARFGPHVEKDTVVTGGRQFKRMLSAASNVLTENRES